MAIDGVSSSTGSPVTQSQAQSKAVAAKPAEEQVKAKQQAQAKQQEPEAPRPVVNTQGQKTGTIVNTTA